MTFAFASPLTRPEVDCWELDGVWVEKDWFERVAWESSGGESGASIMTVSDVVGCSDAAAVSVWLVQPGEGKK